MSLQRNRIRSFGKIVFLSSLLLMSTACGVRKYPGQPGIVTNGFSKLSLEVLETDGLFFYETTYDNRAGKTGVQSVTTKLYPEARTFTSNVRTNSEGTKYITRDEYQGAVVQMIYLPPTDELILPEGSKIQVIIDYKSSMDEIDHSNQSELSMFKVATRALGFGALPSDAAIKQVQQKMNLLRAAKLDTAGNLTYTVTKVRVGQQEFLPNKLIQVQTNLAQSGVRSSLTKEGQRQIAAFIEAKFPVGFLGEIQVSVQGSQEPITFHVGLNTPKTLEAAGTRVHRNVSKIEIQKWLQRTRILNEKQAGVRK